LDVVVLAEAVPQDADSVRAMLPLLKALLWALALVHLLLGPVLTLGSVEFLELLGLDLVQD